MSETVRTSCRRGTSPVAEFATRASPVRWPALSTSKSITWRTTAKVLYEAKQSVWASPVDWRSDSDGKKEAARHPDAVRLSDCLSEFVT